MCVEEMVYRVLSREQFSRMLHIAARQTSHNPISAVLTFARAHYAEPLTVNDLAKQVALSPSAFSALFREVTGRTPYQFLKEYSATASASHREPTSTRRMWQPGCAGCARTTSKGVARCHRLGMGTDSAGSRYSPASRFALLTEPR
ncbi:AraC family transcriptional regulator [Nonomuraea angiospora]